MKHARGFTLIELVIVAIVVSIMAAVITPLALSSLKAYDSTLSDLIVLDKLRYATERLAREIREVNYDTGSTSYTFTGVGMGTNSMKFTRSYYDSSGTPPTTRDVTVDNAVVAGYTGTSVTLTYSDMTGAQVLTDQLGSASDLAFAYYQQDGALLATDPTNVRYVQITLTLRQNGNPYTQRTRVELRNR